RRAPRAVPRAGLMFRRARFGELIERQRAIFERDQRFVIEETEERLEAYNRAERDEAEELYGDYVDAVETGTEGLADIRDHFKGTLEEDVGEQCEREFNRAVAKRLPRFSLEIDLR